MRPILVSLELEGEDTITVFRTCRDSACRIALRHGQTERDVVVLPDRGQTAAGEQGDIVDGW